MSKVFYINEILDFAVEREIQSQILYRRLANHVEDPQLKAIFERLVKEELHHEEVYQEMLNEVKKHHSAGAPTGEEYDAYMRELIAISRKKSPAQDIDLNDLEAVLDYAIGREKDAITFYKGLENYVPKTAYSMIDKIIKEEGSHIVMLSKIKENL